MADVSAGGVHNKILGNHVLTRDAALLKDTVREAGALALSLFRTELKNWTKGISSPVSEADIRVNDLLESRLRSATPDYGWLSEESTDDGLSRCTSGFGPAMREKSRSVPGVARTDLSFNVAPCPRTTKKNSSLAGANTAASTGVASATSATLTHQSSRWAR